VFRDPLSILSREAGTAPVPMVAPSFAMRADVPVWPSGLARFDDGILEIVGDGLRVAARDIRSLEVVPALGARLQLRLTYRKGFDTIERRYWVAVAEHDHLLRLVAQVRGALRARATATAVA